MALSMTRIKDGSTVTQLNTPKRTPFAMTMPRSSPSVNDIKHSAMKPAMVVREEPVMETMVEAMASAMASLRSAHSSLCSLKLE